MAHSFTRYQCGVCGANTSSMAYCDKGWRKDQCGFFTHRWTTTTEQKRWEDMSYEERQKISPGYDD